MINIHIQKIGKDKELYWYARTHYDIELENIKGDTFNELRNTIKDEFLFGNEKYDSESFDENFKILIEI